MEEGEESTGGVKNAFYTIMVDYSKNNSHHHKTPNIRTTFLDMDMLASLKLNKRRSYELRDFNGDGQIDRVHNGLNDVEVTFTPDYFRFGEC